MSQDHEQTPCPGSLVDELRALIAAVPEEGLPETVQVLRDIVEFYNMPKVTVPEPEIRYLKSSGVRIQERPPFYLDLGEAADIAAEHESRWQAERRAFRNLLAIVFGDGGQRTDEFRDLVEAGAAAEQVAAAARQEAADLCADRGRLDWLDADIERQSVSYAR